MAQLLKLAQLAHCDGVPKMQIRGSGIVAAVHTQRPPQQQALAQLGTHFCRQLRVAILSSLH